MNTSARKRLVTAGLFTVTAAIALALTRFIVPHIIDIFGSTLYRLTLRTPIWLIWLVAFPAAIGFGGLAGLMLTLANDDLDDIPRQGPLKIVPRVAVKTLLAGILGAVAIFAFLLWSV